MGTLERLQKYIYDYLRGINDLKYAAVNKESEINLSPVGSDEGLDINVMFPIPQKASKFAAGPTFSEVEICLEVRRQDVIAARAPSMLTVCEIVSRALHNWTPPLETGYGRITLSQNQPWEKMSADTIKIRFNVQSVLL